jgi:hypothetical protein
MPARSAFTYCLSSNSLNVLFGAVGKDDTVIFVFFHFVNFATAFLFLGSEFDVAESACHIFPSNDFLYLLGLPDLSSVQRGLFPLAKMLGAKLWGDLTKS